MIEHGVELRSVAHRDHHLTPDILEVRAGKGRRPLGCRRLVEPAEPLGERSSEYRRPAAQRAARDFPREWATQRQAPTQRTRTCQMSCDSLSAEGWHGRRRLSNSSNRWHATGLQHVQASGAVSFRSRFPRRISPGAVWLHPAHLGPDVSHPRDRDPQPLADMEIVFRLDAAALVRKIGERHRNLLPSVRRTTASTITG